MKFYQIDNVLTLNIIFKAIEYKKDRIYSIQCYNINVPSDQPTPIDFKFFALKTLTDEN